MSETTSIDLAAKYPGTDISNAEVFGLGIALLNSVGAVIRIGHASPASTLDYWGMVTGTSDAMLRDYVAWTSGRKDTVVPDGSADRLRKIVQDSGWLRQQEESVAAKLGGAA